MLKPLEDHDDTPTRINTRQNAALAEMIGHNGDGDAVLKGPLNMPALPQEPGEGDFTMEMLTAKLTDVSKHPDENQPLALQEPGLDLYPKEQELSKPHRWVSKCTCVP